MQSWDHVTDSGLLLRCLLFICALYGISMLFGAMPSAKPAVLRSYPSHLHFGVSDEKNATQIVLLVSGADACNQAITMLKSLFLYLGRFDNTAHQCASRLQRYSLLPVPKPDATNPIEFHLLVDHMAHNVLFEQFTRWKPQKLAFHFYDTEQYMELVNKLPSGHYSGSRSYLKLFLPHILPTRIEKVIMLDADMLLAADIHLLWRLFDEFNATQAIGMVKEQNPFFWSFIGRHYWPNLGYGYNAGLILVELSKLRALHWTSLWETVYNDLFRRVGGALPTAEQDVLNRIGHFHPELLFTIPCTWNVQLSSLSRAERCPISWSFTSLGWNESRKAGLPEANLLHFNAHIKPETFYPKPWRIPQVEDDGHMLSNIERSRKYFELYYLLRALDVSCFV